MDQNKFAFKGDNFYLQIENIENSDSFRIISKEGSTWVVSYKSQIHHCQVKSFDPVTKIYIISVGTEEISFQLMDSIDIIVEEMGMNEKKTVILDQIIAPMPGLVVSSEVSIGDEVEEGSPLIILEAMKMENILKATGSGTVKEILVSHGDKVEKGQVLIKF